MGRGKTELQDWICPRRLRAALGETAISDFAVPQEESYRSPPAVEAASAASSAALSGSHIKAPGFAGGYLHPDPPIPAQWHDLWDAIKREAKDTHEAIHNLGVEVARQLDKATGSAPNPDTPPTEG